LNQTTVIIVIALVIAAIALLLVMRRGSRPSVTSDHHDTIGDAATTAIEDTVGQFLQADVTPDFTPPPASGPADELTVLKGLGPKAAARLNELGVTRYDQLAALDGDALVALDARMDAFKGRITRDRWVDQAGYLARGDKAGFEATFGKLG
jgi:predicted flap endonuclease-1-like 5' DNA nuclease